MNARLTIFAHALLCVSSYAAVLLFYNNANEAAEMGRAVHNMPWREAAAKSHTVAQFVDQHVMRPMIGICAFLLLSTTYALARAVFAK